MAYAHGYCGADTIAVIKNPNNPDDYVGAQHNNGLISILPTFNFNLSNIDSEALTKVSAFAHSIGYNTDSVLSFYNQGINKGYFPFSQLPELDSLGNRMNSQGVISSYANNYVQQIYNYSYQYLNTETITSSAYNSFCNSLVSLEASIKNDSRISSNEKQALLSAYSIGRYSASYWGNKLNNLNNNNTLQPLFLQKLKRWLRVVCCDIGGVVAGIVGGPVGVIVGGLGGSIVADASL